MAWEVAIVGGIVAIVMALFYVANIFDAREHGLFKIFLFFMGLYLIIISISLDQNVLVSANATINNSDVYGDLESNLNTSYYVGIFVVIVSLMYWFIYFLRKSLETLKLKKVSMTEGDDEYE